MEGKYYIPSTEELIDGFKFEYQYYDEELDKYTDNWVFSVFDYRNGLGHDLTHQFSDGTVRAKILDKTDIEGLGFTLLDKRSYADFTFKIPSRNLELDYSISDNNLYIGNNATY